MYSHTSPWSDEGPRSYPMNCVRLKQNVFAETKKKKSVTACASGSSTIHKHYKYSPPQYITQRLDLIQYIYYITSIQHGLYFCGCRYVFICTVESLRVTCALLVQAKLESAECRKHFCQCYPSPCWWRAGGSADIPQQRSFCSSNADLRVPRSSRRECFRIQSDRRPPPGRSTHKQQTVRCLCSHRRVSRALELQQYCFSLHLLCLVRKAS